MVLGVGIDLVSISRIERLVAKDAAFVAHTFGSREREEAQAHRNPAEYLAGRFAVKEATFKALDPLLATNTPDLRLVQTLTGQNGAPYILRDEVLEPYLQKAGVTDLQVSITHEAGIAQAIVIAQGDSAETNPS